MNRIHSAAIQWPHDLKDPSGKRKEKPRTYGLTMVIDKGLGLRSYTDLLETAHEYIDVLKFGFGTPALLSSHILRTKLKLAKEYGIIVMPGGTFLEIALVKGKVDEFLCLMKEAGFTGLEISDGCISMSRRERNELIKKATDEGFIVSTEFGKKDETHAWSLSELAETFAEDMNNGALWMTIEGRESGKGVGIYDNDGCCDVADMDAIMNTISDPERIMWEAPLKDQQAAIIKRGGVNVNLGNVAPHDVISLEALRRGLRYDTMSDHIFSYYEI
ncbi:phosphosulfolactate synthase [Paenibacillus sp. 481]|uniref:phosphosulfolactate synthase n=1 Tax=Paenibacillus sp. 481 TaxID=2835869 RepID=UPI001E5E288D|nr:phosphosulfolactate synthase [Paenibacillus sp. 481]UHA72867.1 phosphosulfolactate synthase [Paenibacillus sp. 481]